MKQFIRGASRSATNSRMWMRAGLASIILLLTLGLVVSAFSSPAQAETQTQAAKTHVTKSTTQKSGAADEQKLKRHTPGAEADCKGVHLRATAYDGSKQNKWESVIGGQPYSGTFGSSLDKLLPVPQDGTTVEWSATIQAYDGSYKGTYEGTVGPCGTPPDACPDLLGNQPPGTNCTPPPSDTCPSETTWVDADGDGVIDEGECQTMPPPAYLHPKATVRAYCVTQHWGEGIARLINKQSTQSVRYHIVRSGRDRFVTVGAHKTRRIDLRHLRVGSVVRVKVGKHVVLDRDKVEGGCGTPPNSHTGFRTGAKRAAAG